MVVGEGMAEGRDTATGLQGTVPDPTGHPTARPMCSAPSARSTSLGMQWGSKKFEIVSVSCSLTLYKM